MQPQQLKGFTYDPLAIPQSYDPWASWRAEQSMLAASRNQPPPQKKRGLASSLLPAAGAIGAGLIAAPFTGGLSLAGTIAALGGAAAVGGGLGELGAQKREGEQFNLGKIGKEAALSGAFGAGGAAFSGARGLRAAHAAGLTGKAARQAAAPVARGAMRAKDLGTALSAGGVEPTGRVAGGLLRQSTIAGKSGLGSYTDQKALVDVTRSFTQLKGSAFNKFKNVEPVIGKLNDKVGTLLKGSGASVDASVISRELDTARSFITGSGELNKFNNIIRKGVKQVFGTETPKTVSLQQINQLRKYVNSQASTVFKKLETGGALTSTDDAILGARESLTNLIDEYAPKAIKESVNRLNRQQSVLIKGMPEFKRLSEEGIQVLGTRVPGISKGVNRAIQAGSDYAGRGIAMLPSGLAPQARRQLGPRIAGSMIAPQAPQDLEALPLEDQSAVSPTGTQDLGQYGNVGAMPQSPYPLENAIMDIQRDPKNAKKYMDYYNFVSKASGVGAGGTKLGAEEKKRLLNANLMEETLNSLEGALQQFNLPDNQLQATGRGLYARTIGRLVDEDTKVYLDQIRLDAIRAIRSAGEVGNLSATEQSAALNSVPSLSDTASGAQRKIQRLRQLLVGAQRNAVSQLQGGGQTSLEESIMQLQPQYGGGY